MITYYTPCYNKAQFIDRTFRSLLDQTIFDFEWIVIKGIQLVFSDLLNHTLSTYNFLWYSVLYYRFSLHSDYSIWKLVKDVPILSTLIGFPLGGVLCYREN